MSSTQVFLGLHDAPPHSEQGRRQILCEIGDMRIIIHGTQKALRFEDPERGVARTVAVDPEMWKVFMQTALPKLQRCWQLQEDVRRVMNMVKLQAQLQRLVDWATPEAESFILSTPESIVDLPELQARLQVLAESTRQVVRSFVDRFGIVDH